MLAAIMQGFRPVVLRKLRKQKGWSGQYLADLMNALALENADADDQEKVISQQHISRWEIGKRTPNSKSLSRLAKVFNVQVGVFFGQSDPQADKSTKVSRNVLLESLYQAILKGDERKQAQAVAALKEFDDIDGASGE